MLKASTARFCENSLYHLQVPQASMFRGSSSSLSLSQELRGLIWRVAKAESGSSNVGQGGLNPSAHFSVAMLGCSVTNQESSFWSHPDSTLSLTSAVLTSNQSQTLKASPDNHFSSLHHTPSWDSFSVTNYPHVMSSLCS